MAPHFSLSKALGHQNTWPHRGNVAPKTIVDPRTFTIASLLSIKNKYIIGPYSRELDKRSVEAISSRVVIPFILWRWQDLQSYWIAPKVTYSSSNHSVPSLVNPFKWNSSACLVHRSHRTAMRFDGDVIDLLSSCLSHLNVVRIMQHGSLILKSPYDLDSLEHCGTQCASDDPSMIVPRRGTQWFV